MATRIRLQRHGKKGRPFYKIVIADARAPRDGRYIEMIGSYNPTTIPATIEVESNRALDWLLKGAQPSDTVKAILKYRGVYFKKHLKRGVDKGAMTEEQAEEKFQAWLSSKDAKIADAQTEAQKAKASKIKASVEAGKEKAEAKLKAESEPAAIENEATEEVIENSAAAETETVDQVETAVEETQTEAVAETEAPVEEEAPVEAVAEEEASIEETPAEDEEGKA